MGQRLAQQLLVAEPMAERGGLVRAADFLAGLQAVEALRSAASVLFAEWDAILMPACAAMPWPAGEPFPPMIDAKRVDPRGHAVYTGWVNAAGHPAIALPAPVGPESLPIGVQLIGDLGAEDRLLALAAEYEAAFAWAGRWPKPAA